MRSIFSVSEQGTGAGPAVWRRHTAALEVGHPEECEAEAGGHSDGKSPSGTDAGWWRGDWHAIQRQLQRAEGLLLLIDVELHGKCGQNCSH